MPRWGWVLLAMGCAPDDGALFSQLSSVTLGKSGAVAFDELVLRDRARLLLSAEVDPQSAGDFEVVSSDPRVLTVAPLEEGSWLWDGVADGSVQPLSGDQAIGFVDDADGLQLAMELVSGAPGVAELSWVDLTTGEVMDVRSVEVHAPARTALALRNPVGWDMLPVGSSTLHLLEGVDFTLELRSFDEEGRALSGVTADRQVVSTREVAPDDPTLAAATWEWVGPDDIVALDLRPSHDAEDHAGLLLVGIDRAGNDVYGLAAQFSHAEPGAGDFFVYQEDPQAPDVEVTASWGEFNVAATIQTPYSGKVLWSDEVGTGCDITGPAPVRWVWALALLTLVARRIRRG